MRALCKCDDVSIVNQGKVDLLTGPVDAVGLRQSNPLPQDVRPIDFCTVLISNGKGRD